MASHLLVNLKFIILNCGVFCRSVIGDEENKENNALWVEKS